MTYKTSAIIVAAGTGTRMNLPVNKQFIEIGGIPVLARTLECFNKCDLINEIILVVNNEFVDFTENQIVKKYDISKVKCIISGGIDRGESVRNGLDNLSGNVEYVAVHDGARPFISSDIIERCILDAKTFGASCTAVKAKDTIKQSDKDGFIEFTPDRNMLWQIQTPQVFEKDLLVRAYEKSKKEGYKGTDDSSLVELLGHRVKLTLGSYDNIKITTVEDLTIGEAIINKFTTK